MAVAVYRETNYPLSTLVDEIARGAIALPDIQRPFVWKASKVRDLFDSLYRGFPVGHLLFWETGAEHGARRIGTAHANQQAVPKLMIVDGQQRLTSLYSVLRGEPIIRQDYTTARIRIAFRPRTAKFEVTDAAIERDPEFIADISTIWAPSGRRRVALEFMDRLRNAGGIPTSEDEDLLHEAVDQLYDILQFSFSTIELNASVNEDQVADIFVRINSEGVRLSQADFILTMMSVWWEQGRKDLERFARDAKLGTDGVSPTNPFIDPSPDQMLRVVVGLALRRGRLSAVYQALRGRDVDTGEFSPEARERQFGALRDAQNTTLDLMNWHEFLKCVRRAGYRSGSMITSDNNLLFSYLFYLVGRTQHGMPHKQLRDVIARWFFMSALTGRYTGAFESQVEADLRRLDGAESSEDFVGAIDAMIDNQFTNDYWTINLPNALDTSAGYSPTLFGYHASLVLLEAKALFSNLTVSELLDPSVHAPRASIERHHLFPRAYLERIGVQRQVQRNKIANYAFLEWPDNAAIGDASPADYFPQRIESMTSQERERAAFMHALPDRWYELNYDDFLTQRRRRIAAVIRAAFERLRSGTLPFDDAGGSSRSHVSRLRVNDVLDTMESSVVELKSSAYFSYKPDVPERVVTEAIVKSIAGFLNASGGTLAIGVADDGEILGIGADLEHKGFDADRYVNALTTLLEHALGGAVAARVSIVLEETPDGTVALAHVPPSSSPVYTSTSKGSDVFYVRTNNSTRVLGGPELVNYIRQRWPS